MRGLGFLMLARSRREPAMSHGRLGRRIFEWRVKGSRSMSVERMGQRFSPPGSILVAEADRFGRYQYPVSSSLPQLASRILSREKR